MKRGGAGETLHHGGGARGGPPGDVLFGGDENLRSRALAGDVLGPQHRPIPGVHNSGWVQSPSRHDLVDPNNDPHLRSYVEGVVGVRRA